MGAGSVSKQMCGKLLRVLLCVHNLSTKTCQLVDCLLLSCPCLRQKLRLYVYRAFCIMEIKGVKTFCNKILILSYFISISILIDASNQEIRCWITTDENHWLLVCLLMARKPLQCRKTMSCVASDIWRPVARNMKKKTQKDRYITRDNVLVCYSLTLKMNVTITFLKQTRINYKKRWQYFTIAWLAARLHAKYNARIELKI